MSLYDSNNILITHLMTKAMPISESILIKNKTLDGQWHVQTIGSEATSLNVIVNLTLPEKIILDGIKSITGDIKVIFDGFWYIGIISNNIDYDRTKYTSGPMFQATFTMLVSSKGVI
jgi:hypothetical protein